MGTGIGWKKEQLKAFHTPKPPSLQEYLFTGMTFLVKRLIFRDLVKTT